MAGVAVPVTAQPAAPASTPNSLPVTPSTEHGKEDRIFNKIQAKLTTAVNGAPAIPIPPQSAPIPGQPAQAQPVVVPGEAVNLPAEIELDLAEFDFNAPVIVTPPAADPQRVELTPAEVEAKLAAEIAEAGESAESAKLWKKIDSIAAMHPQGKRMVEGAKFLRAMAEPPTEDGKGGIGRQMSLEEIKAADESHRELQLVRHELNTDIKSFVHNLVSLKGDGRSWLGTPDTIAAVVAELPRVLLEHCQTGNNPVYGHLMAQLATPIFDQMLNAQYQVALSWPGGELGSPEQKAKDRFLDALQVVEYRIKGSARSLDPAGRSPENEAMRRELEQSRQRETSLRQNQTQQMMQAITFANGDNASKAVDKIFAKYGVSNALSKTTLEPQKQAILLGLDRELETLNPGGFQQYQMQLDQVSRGQISPEVAKQTYQTLFENGLKVSPSVKSRLIELVKDAKRITDSSIQRLQSSQTQVAPNGDGKSAAASVIPGQKAPYQPWTPASGMSREEYMAKHLSSGMMAATPNRR